MLRQVTDWRRPAGAGSLRFRRGAETVLVALLRPVPLCTKRCRFGSFEGVAAATDLQVHIVSAAESLLASLQQCIPNLMRTYRHET